MYIILSKCNYNGKLKSHQEVDSETALSTEKKRQQKEKNQQILINSYGMELDVTIENFSIYIRVSGKVCKQFQWAILHDFHMSEHDFSGATTILRYKSLKLAKMFVFIY